MIIFTPNNFVLFCVLRHDIHPKYKPLYCQLRSLSKPMTKEKNYQIIEQYFNQTIQSKTIRQSTSSEKYGLVNKLENTQNESQQMVILLL